MILERSASNMVYNWKRFWCRREGRVDLSDGGFLPDPESDWRHLACPDILPFESVAATPCLVLLGEPGMGKTYAMQSEREAIDARVTQEGGQTIWLDLRSYGSEDRLVRELFQSPAFLSWVEGTHQLHVFLDSLDECLLRIDTLATLLVDEFDKYSVDRLHLRLACRTAAWPASLEEGLKALWGKDRIGVYELAPLRRKDVIEAAQANDLNPEAFVDELARTEVVALAIRPVTLAFLFNSFRNTGRFPSTRAELYQQGCRLLCDEPNQGRRDVRLGMRLSTDQRLVVAARIAAATIFANRYAVWTDVDQGDVPDEDLQVSELVGGQENAGAQRFDVAEAELRETLGTSLFSSRGSNRVGWAHQTYAEFLAAWYLVQHGMAADKIMRLIVHPGDSEGKLVPQLYETAAWLATLAPDLFRRIMEVDSLVLLRSDMTTSRAEDRSALVEALLRLFDEERLTDRDPDIYWRYRKLSHPGLADQLQLYISDSTKGIIVRRVAINIAEMCEQRSLQDALVKVALDPSQPLPIRGEAACAVGRVGDGNAKARLRPLAMGEVGDDPDDELKGYGLKAVWPGAASIEELFDVLTPPKREDLFGAYKSFLLYGFPAHIHPNDLPTALRWVRRHIPWVGSSFSLGKLTDYILRKAWDNLGVPEVTDSFARAALFWLESNFSRPVDDPNSPLGRALTDDDERRHKVLDAVAAVLSEADKVEDHLLYSLGPLLRNQDIFWMLERFRSARSDRIRSVWAHLVDRVFNVDERSQLEAVYDECQKSPILAEQFSRLFKPVRLDSVEADRMRKRYRKMQEWEAKAEPKRLLEPPPAERVATLLDAFESGDSAAWWSLNREMTLNPDSTYYGDELESDLTALPGWETADARTRTRILSAALKYVLENDPETPKWIGTNTLYRPAFAGFRAFRLLLQEVPDSLVGIPAEVWKKWAPIILAYPSHGDSEAERLHQTLVQLAYQVARDEIVDTLMTLIDKENKEFSNIYIIHKVERCWDNPMGQALLTKATEPQLKPECMGSILSELLERRIKGAAEFATALVHTPLPSSGEERDRAVVAARALLAYADDGGWAAVWPAIERDAEFGREVVLTVAHGSEAYSGSLARRLTEEQVADLYIWLERQFPHMEDPQYHDAHAVTPRESVGSWRQSLLGELQTRGTREACEAIRRLARELPELDWMKYALLEAQSITRRRTWEPLRVTDLLRLTVNPQLQLVRSGDELLTVLRESLDRLETQLQGETPTVGFLWNEMATGAYRPKEEAALSDYVKVFLDTDLKQRGIIVNREVQIHRGERTDIHVDAVVRQLSGEVYDSITAIIEAKECWNQELDNAMKTQLVERYLKDNRCQHGMYLVGWFNCDKWDVLDYRKRQAPQLSCAQAQAQFDAQAAELSQQELSIRAYVLDGALR